jgi:hypothetical protein
MSIDALTRAEIAEASAEGIKKVLSDKEIVMSLFGDAIVAAAQKAAKNIYVEENRVKWDRAFGVDCMDHASMLRFREQIDWMKEMHAYVHTAEGQKSVENMKTLAKIDNVDILKDVAAIASNTKQKVLRAFVLILLAAFFSALGWTTHNIDIRTLLEHKPM